MLSYTLLFINKKLEIGVGFAGILINLSKQKVEIIRLNDLGQNFPKRVSPTKNRKNKHHRIPHIRIGYIQNIFL